jgi:hypothetical protein
VGLAGQPPKQAQRPRAPPPPERRLGCWHGAQCKMTGCRFSHEPRDVALAKRLKNEKDERKKPRVDVPPAPAQMVALASGGGSWQFVPSPAQQPFGQQSFGQQPFGQQLFGQFPVQPPYPSVQPGGYPPVMVAMHQQPHCQVCYANGDVVVHRGPCPRT